jgi:hypothetical protein
LLVSRARWGVLVLVVALGAWMGWWWWTRGGVPQPYVNPNQSSSTVDAAPR